MSDEVKHSLIWGLVVAMLIGFGFHAGVQCNARSVEAYKACLSALPANTPPQVCDWYWRRR